MQVRSKPLTMVFGGSDETGVRVVGAISASAIGAAGVWGMEFPFGTIRKTKAMTKNTPANPQTTGLSKGLATFDRKSFGSFSCIGSLLASSRDIPRLLDNSSVRNSCSAIPVENRLFLVGWRKTKRFGL